MLKKVTRAFQKRTTTALILAAIIIVPFFAIASTNALPDVLALFSTSLQSPISSAATTMTLASASYDGGSFSLASSTYGFVIDEGTSIEEIVTADCTGVNCTNMSRGLSRYSGTTTIPVLQFAHRRGASVKITNAPTLLIINRILQGIGALPNPLKYNSIATSTIGLDRNNIPSVGLVQDIAFNGAGVIDASDTAKGVVETATGAEAAAGTTNGSAGRLALGANIATATYTSGTAANKVVVTGTAGFIDSGFISTSTLFQKSFVAGENITVGNAVSFVQDLVAYSTSSPGTSNSGATSLTYSYTIQAGNSRALLVNVSDSSGDNTTSVTYAGIPMTQVGKVAISGGIEFYLYGLLNPTLGANNIVITRSSATSAIVSSAAQYTGVGTISSYATSTSNTTVTILSATTTSRIDGQWLVGAAYSNNTSLRSGNYQVLRTLGGGAVGMFDSNQELQNGLPILATVNEAGSATMALINALIGPAATSTTIKKTNATSLGNVRGFVGFATQNITSGQSGLVNVGKYVTGAGLTNIVVGAQYYLSDTAGQISSTTPGTFQRVVGKGLSATELVRD